MSAGRESSLVIVSDLHMSAGADPRTGRMSRHEHFRADRAFVSFLDHLAGRATSEKAPPHLVILGDMLDLLYVTRSSRGREASWPDSSEPAVHAKLDRVAAGHQEVFQALARLLGAGCQITIVPGNHDVELIRPATQRRFRELVTGGAQIASLGIEFRPWIFYEPGLVYAEHGSQHHDLNAFVALLSASRPGPEGIALPVGSRLSLYLIDLAERAGSEEGEAPATAGAVFSRLKTRPRVVVETLPLHARFAWHAVARSAIIAHALRNERRSNYVESELGRHARELGLHEDTLVAIHRLAQVSPFSLERRALRELVAVPVLRSLKRRRTQPSPYLETAARNIHSILRNHGEDVPFYVFGHTHRATDTTIFPSTSAPRYFNAGTWSTLLARRPGNAGGRWCPFVEISRGAGKIPAASLRWWDGRD